VLLHGRLRREQRGSGAASTLTPANDVLATGEMKEGREEDAQALGSVCWLHGSAGCDFFGESRAENGSGILVRYGIRIV
jgi:hypothetical protein